jgi:hypothetical protein
LGEDLVAPRPIRPPGGVRPLPRLHRRRAAARASSRCVIPAGRIHEFIHGAVRPGRRARYWGSPELDGRGFFAA